MISGVVKGFGVNGDIVIRFNQDLSNIDTFGLDETSVAKGHDYITLFVYRSNDV
jgi:hypothetical protein